MSNGQDDSNVPPWRALQQKKFEQAKREEEEKKREEEEKKRLEEAQRGGTQNVEKQNEQPVAESSLEPPKSSPQYESAAPQPAVFSRPVASSSSDQPPPAFFAASSSSPAPASPTGHWPSEEPDTLLTDEQLALKLHAELNEHQPPPQQSEPILTDEELARRFADFGDAAGVGPSPAPLVDEDGVRAPDQPYRERLVADQSVSRREQEEQEIQEAKARSLEEANAHHLRPSNQELEAMLLSEDPNTRSAAEFQLEENGYSQGN